MSLSPAQQAAQAAAILSAINDIYVSRLLSGAALTLAVYDWCLVLPDEIDTIFKSRWTLPKALYFYIRIITPPGILLCSYQLSDLRPALSDSFCTAWAMLQTFGMLSSLIAANAILTLRLIALYRRKNYMVWFIRAFFAASYIATAGLVIDSMVIYSGNIFYSTIIRVCGTHSSSRTFQAVFYAPAAFEFFVFALTAWRGWEDAKVITGSGSAPFLMVLYRDGFVSFVVMAAMRIWNIWIYVTQPLSTYNLGTQLMWAISTILTTRVYLNLVCLAKQPLPEATSFNTRMPGMTTGGQGGTNIRMRVTTFTEVQTDMDWSNKRRETLVMGSMDDGKDRVHF